MKNYEEAILTELNTAVDTAIEKHINNATSLEVLTKVAADAINRFNQVKASASSAALINVANDLQNTDDDNFVFAFQAANGWKKIHYLTADEVYRLAKAVIDELPLSEMRKVSRSKRPIDIIYSYLSAEDDEFIHNAVRLKVGR